MHQMQTTAYSIQAYCVSAIFVPLSAIAGASHHRAHLAANAVRTAESGADLIPASWNPDVAFEMIAALASAAPEDAALDRAMRASKERLDAHPPK